MRRLLEIILVRDMIDRGRGYGVVSVLFTVENMTVGPGSSGACGEHSTKVLARIIA